LSLASGYGRARQRHLNRRLRLAYGLPLATLNRKDFAGFAEHGGLALIAR
jgi:hypothetical protein